MPQKIYHGKSLSNTNPTIYFLYHIIYILLVLQMVKASLHLPGRGGMHETNYGQRERGLTLLGFFGR